MHRFPLLVALAILAASCSTGDGAPLLGTEAAPPTSAPGSTTAPPSTAPPSTVPPSTSAPAPTGPPTTGTTRPDPSTSSVPDTTTTMAPAPGSAGVGDPYFPELGNGGYDVAAYHLDLDIDPRANTLEGRTTIEAVATQALSRFNLDLLGLTVRDLRVDGRPAGFTRAGPELTVTPDSPLTAGASFVVEVDYGGTPETVSMPSTDVNSGWVHSGDLVYVAAEPSGAHTWFPGNDHPADKALFSFELTVPDPAVAVANGRLVETVADGDRTTFRWEMAEPMATYLATVVVGDLERVEHPGPEGIAIRDYLPPRLADDPPAPFADVGDIIEFLATRFGPYPFDAYGHVVVPGYPGALETQTISLFGTGTIGEILETIVVHEVAHHWFGDSVTPSTWRDIWLNEGFATYAEWLWIEHRQGGDAMLEEVWSTHNYLTFADHSLTGDPGVDDLFGQSVYVRGALTLHALRMSIGDATFFEVLRAWADRYRYSNASTADFIALCEELSGRDLEAFFDAWLYQERLPELPEPPILA